MAPVTPPATPPEPEAPSNDKDSELPGSWPFPRFALRIEDLSHPGAAIFLRFVNVIEALKEAALASFTYLYTPETVPRKVQTILLVLRPMEGVAYTCGTDNAKEIHLSLDYVNKVAERAADEIRGVLVHEVVHCYQHNACDTCPGGLIEGVADYVRLKAGYSPPHWKRRGGDEWDAGYETTGYFLEWIEERYGDGSVKELNMALHGVEYDEQIFKQITGRKVTKLWKLYCAYLEGTTPVSP